MSTVAPARHSIQQIIGIALRGELTDELAAIASAMGPEATCAVMLAASRRIAELVGASAQGPHTPSGAIPPYAKPSTSKRRGGKVGAKPGHEGHRRPAPRRIDRREHIGQLKHCPHCKNPVRPARRFRKRIIEDLPVDLAVEVVEYIIPRHWCAGCKKHVEPKVSAALPGATIGHRLVAMTAVFHYGLGLTIDQTRQILLSPLQMKVSAGGLIDLWRRTAEVLLPWYEQIARDARNSATLHADETSWRVDGETHWLWCFCNHDNCHYIIDRGRGSPRTPISGAAEVLHRGL